jgi:polar amino acid transport system substrate-binding protein
MMIQTRRRALVMALGAGLLIVGLTTTPARADQDTLAAIKSAGKLRLALEFGRPPWAFKDATLKMTGSDYETAELLAADLGVKLEIVEVTGPNRIAFLQTSKADVVVSTFSITPERLKVVDFSAPYASSGVYIAAPKGIALKSVADLKGRRVGVTRATTADAEMTKLERDGRAEVVRFDDESTSMTALASGQVDIVAQDPATIAEVARRNPARLIEPKFVLTQFPVGVGLRKNDPALKAWLDQWIKTSLANGKLGAIYKKFHGIDLPNDFNKPAI